MDWLFLSHVKHSTGKKTLLIGKGKDIDYALNLASKNNLEVNCEILNTDKDIIDSNQGHYDLVIIVDRDVPSAKKNHFACTKFKQNGSCVVFGLCRGLHRATPKSPPSGLSYVGMFSIASEYIKGVRPKGDYMEFGVFDGRTVTLAYHTFGNFVNRFFALDSFEGIIGSLDDEKDIFKDGMFFSNEATFWHNMEVANVNTERVYAIKADFVTSLQVDLLKKYKIENVSVVHIDCDVYLPAKRTLDFITDVLSDGALLIFDDYDHLAANPNKGERRALREWVHENKHIEVEEYRRYATMGRSFIVHKK